MAKVNYSINYKRKKKMDVVSDDWEGARESFLPFRESSTAVSAALLARSHAPWRGWALAARGLANVCDFHHVSVRLCGFMVRGTVQRAASSGA